MLGSKIENAHSAKKPITFWAFEIQSQCEIRVMALSRTLTTFIYCK